MENSKSEAAPGQNKTYTIIVNGRPREFSGHQITYEDVVGIAFHGITPSDLVDFTVTYSSPHGKDGTLVSGQHTPLKEGMVFNVTKTNRS